MAFDSLRAIFLGEVDVPAEHRDAVGAARRKAFHALAPMAAIHSLLNAVVLTALSYAIFIYGLQLTIPVWPA